VTSTPTSPPIAPTDATASTPRTVVWGILDQAVSSALNLAIGIGVARAVSAPAFGSFALAFTTYVLALGVSRALTSEPLLVRSSGTSRERWRAEAGDAIGTAGVVGAVVGMTLLAVAAATSGSLAVSFAIVGVAMPALIVQDACRMAFFAAREPRRAFQNDLAWLAALLPLLAVASAAEELAFVLAVWAASAYGAALLALFQARILPRPVALPAWLTKHRALAPRFLTEFVIVSGAFQVALYAVAAFTGTEVVGALRGAVMLFGPVSVLMTGISFVAIPESIQLMRRSAEVFRRTTRRVALALASVCALWGLALLLIPDSLGTGLLGSSWQGARDASLPLSLAFAASGVTLVAVAALRAMAAAERSLRARLIGAPAIFPCAIAGGLAADAAGAALGLAAALWIGAAVAWLEMSRALDATQRQAP
jgi:O-antigen/teichoic acid export membrane protein